MLKNIRESIHKLRENHRLINSHLETYYDKSSEKDHLEFFTRAITKAGAGRTEQHIYQ